MFFMSTSVVLRQSLGYSMKMGSENPFSSCNASCAAIRSGIRGKRCRDFVCNAKRRRAKKKSWWQRFFFDDEGNWFGFKDEDMLDLVESEGSSGEDDLSEYEKFEAWRRRAEAIVELKEAQEDVRNEEDRRWEDWLVDESGDDAGNGAAWIENSNGAVDRPENYVGRELNEFFPGRGLVNSVMNSILGTEDDDILYEDRVFRYASFNSAKFLAVLILVPWALDFLVHDYVLMPFLDRYVKKVPLAAEMLDVRRSQKLEIIKTLNIERARYHLEVEIGKSPPLSDEELYMELRQKALELRDEWRLENRKAFANIWSDIVFGVSIFLILYFCQNQVALLKFTGYKLLNNITDSGKAFLIILVTDIFLGYHSESGWHTLLEILFEHYGFEVDPAAITIFVCIIPVIMDACVKLWVCLLFKFLPKLSPKVSSIFQEMKRH